MMEPSTGEVLGSIMVQEREPRGPVQVRYRHPPLTQTAPAASWRNDTLTQSICALRGRDGGERTLVAEAAAAGT